MIYLTLRSRSVGTKSAHPDNRPGSAPLLRTRRWVNRPDASALTHWACFCHPNSVPAWMWRFRH